MVKKKIGHKLLVVEVLREYGENLVELLEVVPYGMGVGGNEADDGAQKQQRNERD